MSHVDPSLIAFLTASGLAAALAQLILACATFIRQKANRVELTAKVEENKNVLSAKVDENTALTKDIHQVTNGPLSNMEATVGTIETKVDTHAAEARSTAEAAKVQAATDAKAASKDSS
jgi:hypothetical protein